ncbi:MAG TPA: hypothetical protein VJ583_03320 [Nitrososphaeraceae archaeon]|nr:hypothetical protein [Nitrososphaeraceae archaeon]
MRWRRTNFDRGACPLSKLAWRHPAIGKRWWEGYLGGWPFYAKILDFKGIFFDLDL